MIIANRRDPKVREKRVCADVADRLVDENQTGEGRRDPNKINVNLNKINVASPSLLLIPPG